MTKSELINKIEERVEELCESNSTARKQLERYGELVAIIELSREITQGTDDDRELEAMHRAYKDHDFDGILHAWGLHHDDLDD